MNGTQLAWNTRYPVPTVKLPASSVTNKTEKGCFGFGPGSIEKIHVC